jgi:hypothetical protein
MVIKDASGDAVVPEGATGTTQGERKNPASVAESLMGHRPRENSGAPAANRFGYQRTWALCHLLSLHEQPGDYVLILEFHDDILVLDDVSDPKVIDFYQIKTLGKGHWTKAALVRASEDKPAAPRKGGRKKGAANANAPSTPAQPSLPLQPTPEPAGSILGKLFHHTRIFDNAIVRSLNLVSNATFKLELTNLPTSTDRESFCLNEAKPEELKHFEKALNKELQLTSLPWPKVRFACSSLSLHDHETHGAGVLAAFLEKRQPGGRFAVQPLFRAITGEFSKRAGCEWQPSSFAELCTKKGVRRSDLERFLEYAVERPDSEEQLKEITTALTAEGFAYRDVSDAQEGWRTYAIKLTDLSDTVMHEFAERVRAVVSELATASGWKTLREYLTAGRDKYTGRYGALAAPLTEALLQGALLRELKTYQTRKSSAADTKPQGEAP